MMAVKTDFSHIEKWLEAHGKGIFYVLFVCALAGLWLTTKVNYLLFHSLAELFSIVIATCLFLIAWNSRQYIQNQYLLFIGIAYLFIGMLDLLHTLAYKGMPIFTDYDYYANQLWIGARYLESLTLLAAFSFLKRHTSIRPYLTALLYALITMVIVASVLWWKVFPECFIAGEGLTPFKKYSEYVICIILVGTMVLLRKNRDRFSANIYHLLFISIICTIISELAFTFYIDNYGLSNLIGHYFKIFSFYCIYQAIVKTGIQDPYAMIFRELGDKNDQLQHEVQIRKEAEKKWRKALHEVKTLSGIIPICAQCKQIRNDDGYWQEVENYISTHSEAQFSHGICPACYEKELDKLAGE